MFMRRSLSEDALDRFNHTWAVLFLLLLSLFAWLVPLTPPGAPKEATSSTGAAAFKASCWCPAHFESSQVQYTNTYCQRAFNDYVRGVRPAEGEQVLYPFSPSDLPGPERTTRKLRIRSGGSRSGKMSRSDLHVQIPLSLFILAACLNLPYVVWGLATFWFRLSTHSIIEATKDGQTADSATRQQLIKELISIKSSSSSGLSTCSNAILYLTLKALLCGVVIAETVYTYAFLVRQSFQESGPPVQPDDEDEDAHQPVHCFFQIRQMTQVHDYTVQCIMSRTDQVTRGTENDPQKMYQFLCAALMIFLCAAAVLNVLNLIGWILKLTVLRGQLEQKRSNLSLDDRLLLIMAANNAGFVVARDLEKAIANASDADDSQTTELLEKDDTPAQAVSSDKDTLVLQEIQA